MDRAITCFQKAILLDPNFALAYVGIADTYNAMVPYGYMKPSEGFSEARAAAKRALEIDPLLAEAHSAYAFMIGSYDWNWEEVEREHKRAIDLSPNREGPYFYSQLLRSRSGGSSALMPWFRGGSSSEAKALRSALTWSMYRAKNRCGANSTIAKWRTCSRRSVRSHARSSAHSP